MEKAVVYARYSPGSQQTYQSIEGQLRECHSFAVRNNLEVIEEYIDEHLTGTTDRRPAFLRMIEDSKKKTFQYVIVYQLDRFTRNRYDSATYKSKLKKNGVRVLSARENISSDASGIIMESVLEGMAEYYSAELSQKVIRGRRLSAEKCQYLGGAIPFGYKINHDTMKYELDENNAPLAAQIFQDYVNGKTIIEICQNLNSLGIKTPCKGAWNKNSIHHILNNKKYIGIYTYKEIEIKDGVPAIIDIPLFEAAQRRIKMNKNRKRNTEYPYLLSGKIFCGQCQATLAGESGTSHTSAKYQYYKCSAKKRKIKDCDLPAFKKDYLEDIVIDKLKSFLNDTDLIHEIAIEIEKQATNEELIEMIATSKKELKACESAINNIIKAIEQGVFSSTTKQRLDELEREKADLEYRLATYTAMNQRITASEIEFWFLSKIRNCEKDDNRQMLIDTFINKVVVYPDKIVITFNHSDTSYNNEVTVNEINDLISKNNVNNEKNVPEKSSDTSGLVRLQGLEPWAH